MTVRMEDWGCVEYGSALARQKEIFEEVLSGEDDGVIVFCEHPDIYTIGRGGRLENARGVEVVRVERGGDVTWHGPGQVVVYPIVRLRTGLREYIAALEQAVIATVAEFGITAGRIAGKTGVWVGAKKICAIGVRASRGVVMHGLALNVAADLRNFSRINPCGMSDAEVTSIEHEIGPVDVSVVKEVLGRELFGNLSFRIEDVEINN